jgi:hypothetical protein
MERLLGRAVWLGGIIALLALVIVSRHDIARYIKMARM